MPLLIPERKAMAFRFKDPDAISQVKALMPSQEVDGYLCVPHTEDALRVLSNLGVSVSGLEPIRTRYSWPKLSGKFSPMPHQVTTAAFVTMHNYCYVLNDMRTGKSASCIWATAYLRSQNQCKGTLVICTLTCMESVWKNEIWGITPSASVAIVHGSKDKRASLLADNYDYYIVNHDGIKVTSTAIELAIEEGRIDTIIMDEGAEFRHHNTDKWRTLRKIAKPNTLKRLWWLTATPTPNGPEDAWAQCRIVNPTRVDSYITHWRDKTMRQISTYKWIPKPGWMNMVHEAMQPAIRFAKSDVMELPPVLWVDRKCNLSPAQTKALDMVKREGALMSESGSITAVNAAVLLNKMLQIAAGAVLADNGSVVEYSADTRYQAVRDIMLESKSKTLIFANNHATLDRLYSMLVKAGHRVAQVDGRVTGKERTRRISGFQTMDTYDVLVLHPKPAGHGLELSAADQIIWFCPPFSTDLYIQANNRIQSAKQKHGMGIYHIYCTNFEKAIYAARKAGVADQNGVLALYREATQETFN